jgi:signal transduction histidine kinase
MCEESLPPFLTIDIQRVKQVLANLIGNSLKFTYEGFIRLEASRIYGNQLRIVVRDTGIGIKPED